MLLTYLQKFTIKSIVLMSLCFSLLVKADVSHDNPQIKPIDLPKITVVTEYLEPFQIKNDDGSLDGMATEIIRALFTYINKPLNIKVMPWARAFSIASNEKNTLIYSIARTAPRENNFHWLAPITKEEYYFWGLKTKFPKSIENIELLKSYQTSASRDSNVEAYLLDKKFLKIYRLVTEDQSLQMLSQKRIELMLETELTLRYRANRLGLAFNKLRRLRAVKELNSELYFAFNKQTDLATVELFKNAFKTSRCNKAN